jgi:large repetitive protein
VVKTVDPTVATIGERVEFTISLQIPANTNFYQAAIVDRLPLGLVDPLPVGVPDCVFVEDPPVPCTLTLEGILGPVEDLTPAEPLQPSRVYGLYFGDILAAPSPRNVELTYSALVADLPGNAAGVDLVNTAQTRWDLEDEQDDPDSPLNDWDVAGTLVQATVELVEPNVVVTKAASDDTPEPGQEFTYRIEATNNGTSTAFETVVVDTLPAGVVLIQSATAPLSPDPTATVSADATTITWNVGTLAVGQTVPLTYRAVLAPSAEISASTPVSEFTNTARPTAFQSLPGDPTDTEIREYVGCAGHRGRDPAVPGPGHRQDACRAQPGVHR